MTISPKAIVNKIIQNDEIVIVNVEVAFDKNDLIRAIEHGRQRRWSHEKDIDWASLLIDSWNEGVIDGYVQDSSFDIVPMPDSWPF